MPASKVATETKRGWNFVSGILENEHDSVLHAMLPSAVGARAEQAPLSFQRRGGRVARHLDPPVRDHVYGVQHGMPIRHMACIPQ
jgi:hypothetical protein